MGYSQRGFELSFFYDLPQRAVDAKASFTGRLHSF